MKRTAILLLSLAIALMASNGVSAKGKVRKSSDAAVPSVQAVFRQLDRAISNPTSTVDGFDLLANHYDYKVYYGKNVNITLDSDGDVSNASATSQNAFYFSIDLANEGGASIFFKSKANRDAFFAKFKKTRHNRRWTTRFEERGWYGVVLEFDE